MTDEEQRNFRYEEMRDAFEEMLDLHKRTIILAMELHKAMEADQDLVGIENSKEFLELLAKQRSLIIMGMVHKVNVVPNEIEGRKLIPFPLKPTLSKMDEALHQYIPDEIEQFAKRHAEIMRIANKVGYYYWPLPKQCINHVKRSLVSVYDCAQCEVLEQAMDNSSLDKDMFRLRQQEVYELYRKWSVQFRMLEDAADDTDLAALLKKMDAEQECIHHAAEEHQQKRQVSAEQCYGCLVIRESFRKLEKRKR